jgi:two-component system sensor histidine kinase KdpD
MLAAAADQVGQALEQDRLRAEATSAELARRSDAVKTALLESVSHDLRTPLAAIRAAAGTLADVATGRGEGESAETAQAIDDEAARLDRLVGDLLDMSRIEAGALRVDAQPYALEDLLEASMRRLRPVLAGATVATELPAALPYVLVDATLVDQVIANVLENAVRHAPGATIRVSAGAGSDAGSPRVRLVIEDDGPGVPAAELPRLFDKFYRGAGPRRAGAGSGIGLAVVRGLVEAMGGQVHARAADARGLAIAIDLPAAAPEPA